MRLPLLSVYSLPPFCLRAPRRVRLGGVLGSSFRSFFIRALRRLRLGCVLVLSPCEEVLSLSLRLFLRLQLHACPLLRLSLFQRWVCDLSFCVGMPAVLIPIGASVVASGPIARVPCRHDTCIRVINTVPRRWEPQIGLQCVGCAVCAFPRHRRCQVVPLLLPLLNRLTVSLRGML